MPQTDSEYPANPEQWEWEQPIDAPAAARYALYFATETETFPVFKEWAIKCAQTPRGKAWAEGLTIDSLRADAVYMFMSHQGAEDAY